MELKERLEIFKSLGYTYDHETGNFYVYKKIKNQQPNRINRGTKDNTGYIILSCKVRVKAHQLAWYLYYNEVPSIIDHINRNRSDNRICNLRLVTRSENGFNKDVKGYSYNKIAKKYKSQIQVNKKSIHLGYFNTKDEAHEAYVDAKKKYHII